MLLNLVNSKITLLQITISLGILLCMSRTNNIFFSDVTSVRVVVFSMRPAPVARWQFAVHYGHFRIRLSSDATRRGNHAENLPTIFHFAPLFADIY